VSRDQLAEMANRNVIPSIRFGGETYYPADSLPFVQLAAPAFEAQALATHGMCEACSAMMG